jgi:hypothetical protein
MNGATFAIPAEDSRPPPGAHITMAHAPHHHPRRVPRLHPASRTDSSDMHDYDYDGDGDDHGTGRRHRVSVGRETVAPPPAPAAAPVHTLTAAASLPSGDFSQLLDAHAKSCMRVPPTERVDEDVESVVAWMKRVGSPTAAVPRVACRCRCRCRTCASHTHHTHVQRWSTAHDTPVRAQHTDWRPTHPHHRMPPSVQRQALGLWQCASRCFTV